MNETPFYKDLKYKRVLTIMDDTEEYFELWKKSCDLFFKFLEENCPDLTVILNPSRHVYRILKKDGSIVEDPKFKADCAKYNPYRDMFDEYILKNFDVEVLEFDENTLSVEDHLWGCSSLHYGPLYFVDVNRQLNEIIERNESVKTKADDLINKEIRGKKRQELLRIIQKRNQERRREKRNQFFAKVINKIRNKF